MAAVADINNVVLTGRLTRDIEIKATNSGFPIGNLGLAYSGVKKSQGGGYEEVSNFIDCVLLGTRAEALAQYLVKGAKVAISGELRFHQWESNGQKRSKHEILIDRIQFMSGQKQDGQQASGQYAPQPSPQAWDYDMPF